MPSYEYIHEETGHVIEEFHQIPPKEVPRAITRDDKIYIRYFGGGSRKSGDVWTEGIWSDSLGVNPDQVPQAKAELQAAGIEADFSPSGRLHVKSRQHRNKLLAFYGMHDKDAGYGDRTPN